MGTSGTKHITVAPTHIPSSGNLSDIPATTGGYNTQVCAKLNDTYAICSYGSDETPVYYTGMCENNVTVVTDTNFQNSGTDISKSFNCITNASSALNSSVPFVLVQATKIPPNGFQNIQLLPGFQATKCVQVTDTDAICTYAGTPASTSSNTSSQAKPISISFDAQFLDKQCESNTLTLVNTNNGSPITNMPSTQWTCIDGNTQ